MMPSFRPAHPARNGSPRGSAGLRLRPLLPALLAALVLAACGGGAATTGGAALVTSSDAQMEFGVKMARQGLWHEALFRFRQAAGMAPNDPRLLNNLAVAYEATGQYDEALETYQQALELAPGNRELRRNYARFVEFYQSYGPQPEAVAEEAEDAAPSGGGQPAVER